MTGLDKIIGNIDEQAKRSAAEVLDEASKKRQSMLEDAALRAKEKYDNIISEAEKKCAFNLKSAKASAQSQTAKSVLAEKVYIINETVNEAKRAIMSLPQEDFAKIILKMISNCEVKNDGKVVFNEASLKKLTPDFESRLQELSVGKLVLEKTPCDISDGFIINYGLIEENCTFDAVISAKEPEIKDAVSKILFE